MYANFFKCLRKRQDFFGFHFYKRRDVCPKSELVLECKIVRTKGRQHARISNSRANFGVEIFAAQSPKLSEFKLGSKLSQSIIPKGSFEGKFPGHPLSLRSWFLLFCSCLGQKLIQRDNEVDWVNKELIFNEPPNKFI